MTHGGTISGSSGRSSAPSPVTRAPTLALNSGHGASRDFSRWTGGHASAPRSSSAFASSGGHSAWRSAGTHASGALHSTFNGAGRHFDANHWTSGHVGDVHHFSPSHHGHNDFHPLYFGLGFGLGWGWRSYSYYPSYYSYPYYDGGYSYSYPSSYSDYSPAYYDVPVYSSTDSLYDTNAPVGDMAAQPGDVSGTESGNAPDGFIPRTEVPSQEAPEALPEEKPATPPPNTPPVKSPES